MQSEEHKKRGILSKGNFVLALALLGVSYGAAQLVGRHFLVGIVERFHAEEDAWWARDFSRPSPHGEAEPGNAMPLLLSALALAHTAAEGPDGDPAETFDPLLLEDPDLDPAAQDKRWEEALTRLHRAALKGEARLEFSFEGDLQVQLPPILEAMRLTKVALRHAELLARGGGDEAAAAILLDVLSFGRDLSHATPILLSEMMGSLVISTGFGALTRPDHPIELDTQGWKTLAAGLERIDAGFQLQSPALRGERLFLGRQFESALATTSTLKEILPAIPSSSTLQRGLSRRWLLADLLAGYEDQCLAAQVFEGADWAVVLGGLDEQEAEQETSSPLVRLPARLIFDTRRGAVTELRLLRFLAADRLRVTSPACKDPFGDRFLRRSVEGGTLVWSLGPDGLNDAGTAEEDKDLTVFLPAS